MFKILKDKSSFTLFQESSLQVLKDGWLVGAAVLGVPAKATIKEVALNYC